MRTVATSLIDLSVQVRAIFLQEPRLLKLKPPVYVLGWYYCVYAEKSFLWSIILRAGHTQFMIFEFLSFAKLFSNFYFHFSNF